MPSLRVESCLANDIRRRAMLMSLSALALPARSQQLDKLPRVAWISAGGSPADEARYERRMEERFRQLGWVYGRNLRYEIRRFRGDPVQLQQRAAELAAMKPDVILAGDNYTVDAILKAGFKGSIVVQVGSNLQDIGWVKSYSHPGGQITGLAWDQSAQIVEKTPQFLKELVPNLSRLGEIVDLSIPGAKIFQPISHRAAEKLGITVVTAEVRTGSDLAPAFEKLKLQGAQAVNIWGSPLTYIHMQQLIDLAGRYKLPDMTIFRVATELGALVSYGASIEDLYVYAIGHVDKILRGAKPGDLPVELPTRYELVLNQKRATSLGLTLPQAMLALADEVIR
jgi:putative tryptophan/tyrosine transport system substrate-binding protein